MTTNQLSDIAKKLYLLANKNLESLSGKCQTEIEIQDYYLGLLRREAIILNDLSLLLKDRNQEFITTPFIILRCLLDDFLHLLYLEVSTNKEEEIIKINADSYRQSFNALKDLMVSNHNYFDGKYPYYQTKSEYEKLINEFSYKAKNKKYFKNIEKLKFKDFQPLSTLVKGLTISNEVDIFRDRAYYLWKEFSGFVHYSNYSFYYELQNSEQNLNMINESFQYCYNSIYLAFKYFERELKISFVDDQTLKENYGIIYEC